MCMARVYIKTFGCQMNKRDSEAVAAALLARGHSLVETEAEADVILINTCSVRASAEQKALNKMRALAADARAAGRNVVLGFMGCMAQSRGAELIDCVAGVRLVVGTHKFHLVPTFLETLMADPDAKIVDTGMESELPAGFAGHVLDRGGRGPVTAYVNIMQGCNFRCSYCIVPHTRGAERYRPIAEIVQECSELAAHGVREVTLLGQVVNRYGRGVMPWRDGKSPFVQLLEAVHEVDGIERIRFTAPHPCGFGDDLIEAYARLPKLVESAHIPVQSGSDRILRLMKRGYTRRRYIELVSKLRQVKPEIGLCTDLIVGFPGETEQDFQDTLALVEEVQFDQAFVFKFSARRGTPAAAMPDQVPQHVIEARHECLLKLMNEIGRRRYSRFIGRTVEVLVEGPSRKNARRLTGRTRCNKIVIFEGAAELIGQLVQVRVNEVGTFTLYGELVPTST